MKEAALMMRIPENSSASSNKVPEVTLAFWVIKIAATTLGETGGDALSMTLNLGYALSTLILFGLLCRIGVGANSSRSNSIRFCTGR